MKFTKQTASELPDPSRPSIQSHVSRYIENIHPKWTHKTIWKDVILERIDPFLTILFSGDISDPSMKVVQHT